MELISNRAKPAGEDPGELIEVLQEAHGQRYRKWIWVFGAQGSTVMVQGAVPAEFSEELGEGLRDAVSTAAWDAGAHVGPFEGLSFSLRDTGSLHFPAWWTRHSEGSPESTCVIVTGWAFGDKARAISGKTPQEIRDAAITSLSRALQCRRSVVAEQVLETVSYPWTANERYRGGYSFAPTGCFDAHHELGSPQDNRLFFAGEATVEDGNNATVHGAIQSGIRAANLALEASKADGD